MLCSLETHIPEVLTLENKHDIIIRGHPPRWLPKYNKIGREVDE